MLFSTCRNSTVRQSSRPISPCPTMFLLTAFSISWCRTLPFRYKYRPRGQSSPTSTHQKHPLSNNRRNSRSLSQWLASTNNSSILRNNRWINNWKCSVLLQVKNDSAPISPEWLVLHPKRRGGMTVAVNNNKSLRLNWPLRPRWLSQRARNRR